MRNLAIVIALGWFWLLFYSVGPLTTPSQLVIGAAALVVGSIAFAAWGALFGLRRHP